MGKKKWVFLDHDGGVDDLLALLFVLSMDEVSLLGVNVTPADCYPGYAAEASCKIMDLMGNGDAAVAVSNARGINAFPDHWRAQPQIINAFPPLLKIHEPQTPLSEKTGCQFIIHQLQQCPEPVLYLMTGPCTTLVQALKREPALREKIKNIIWMAGAIHVHGNVRTYTHDGSAEWNVYWDAESAQWLLQQNLPLVLVPLDATNDVPVNKDFLKKMAVQSAYDVSNLASLCWAVTINTIPGYDYLYHMWDVLASVYIGRSELFSTEAMELDVSTSIPNEGETREMPGSGNRVQVVKTRDKEAFYQYLLQLTRKNFKKISGEAIAGN